MAQLGEIQTENLKVPWFNAGKLICTLNIPGSRHMILIYSVNFSEAVCVDSSRETSFLLRCCM